jgi:hypothetical protein
VSLHRTARGALLCSDLGVFQLGGADASAFLARVAPLLDGTRDRDGVAAALAEYSRSSVMRVLDLLESRGLTECVPEGAESSRRSQDEVLRKLAPDPQAAQTRLAAARVIVVGEERWAEIAAAEIAAAGAREVRWGESVSEEGGSLVIGAVSAGDRDRMERVARTAHLAGVPSLWAQLGSTAATIGPLVIPGETACRVCATVDALNPIDAEIDTEHATPAAAGLLGHLVAMEAIKAISGYATSMLGGRISTLDLATMESRRRTLVRIPWCRACA